MINWNEVCKFISGISEPGTKDSRRSRVTPLQDWPAAGEDNPTLGIYKGLCTGFFPHNSLQQHLWLTLSHSTTKGSTFTFVINSERALGLEMYFFFFFGFLNFISLPIILHTTKYVQDFNTNRLEHQKVKVWGEGKHICNLSRTESNNEKGKKNIKETNKYKYQMREDRAFRKKVIPATAVLGPFTCHMVLNHNKLSFILHFATR